MFLTDKSLTQISNDLDTAVTNEDGQKTQKKVWSELVDKLDRIHPGVVKVLTD